MSAKKKTNVPKIKKSKKKESNFMKVIKFLFPKKSKYENIFQYIIRQFYIPDSRGYPSLTVTILVFVMILTAIVAHTEIVNAQFITMIKGVKAPVGFSDTFIYWMIGLSVVITGWYRQRQNKANGNGEDGILEQVKNYINIVVKKIKG